MLTAENSAQNRKRRLGDVGLRRLICPVPKHDVTDFAFCGKIYPRPGHAPVAHEEDWAELEDAEVPV